MPTVTSKEIRLRVEDYLKANLPAAIAALAASEGADLREPRSWHRMVSAERIAEQNDQLPALVTAAGTVDFEQEADGTYNGTWGVAVTVLSRGSSYEQTVDDNDLYVAAVRDVLAKSRYLDRWATGLTITGENHLPAAGRAERTLMAGTVEFDLTVGNVQSIS